jgi:hypothetical protein
MTGTNLAELFAHPVHEDDSRCMTRMERLRDDVQQLSDELKWSTDLLSTSISTPSLTESTSGERHDENRMVHYRPHALRARSGFDDNHQTVGRLRREPN